VPVILFLGFGLALVVEIRRLNGRERAVPEI
jgi:hypothetical protein